MIKMKMIGLQVLENRLKRAIKRANEIPEMVLQEAQTVSDNSRSLAPVKTGKLSGSHYFNKQITNSKLTATIGFKARYAPFQDFGTGKKFKLTSVLAPYSDYISGFKGANQSHKGIRARKFLFHHYVIATRRIARKTGTKVKNLMNT
jgi:hypothetical protein